jgi:hypothetical protein
MKSSNPIVSCQTKTAYRSRQDAEDMATYLFYEKEVDLETYKCQICENWHLSSKK